MFKLFLILSGFLFTAGLFANDEIEGTYIAKSETTDEVYELNLNVEKDSSGEDNFYFHLKLENTKWTKRKLFFMANPLLLINKAKTPM